jgi:hypothetical protein
MSVAVTFVAGASAALALVIALFFARFWRASGDRFFALFALAFLIFAGNRIALTAVSREHDTWIYALRFLAFALIVAAIVEKNRDRTR